MYKMLHPDVLEDFPEELYPMLQMPDQLLRELEQSIRENGILTSLLVRPLENGRYQILDGHSRKRIAQKLELELLPCIIASNMDNTEAIQYRRFATENHNNWNNDLTVDVNLAEILEK